MPELPYADVDSPESIPAECTAGPVSEVYQLQINYKFAQSRYSATAEELAAQYRNQGDTMGWYDHPQAREAREAMERARQEMLAGQAKVGGRVFCVAEDNMEKVEKKIAALNKRAERTGTEPILFVKTGEQIILHYTYHLGHGDTGHEHADFLHTYCTISGGAPKIEGFIFVASILHTETGNIVNRIPTEGYIWREQATGRNLSEDALAQEIESIDLTKYRNTPPFCEHCNKLRSRNETFIVHNREDGTVKQVGRNCLRDYTGIDDPNRLVRNLEQYFEIERFMSSRGEAPSLTMVNFLTHCAAVMRKSGGYVKGLGYDGIRNFLNVGEYDRQTKQPLWVEPTDADQEDARIILHWALNDWDDNSEFANNCKVALSQPTMSTDAKNKTPGLAGAVFTARERYEGRKARQQEMAQKERGFLGEVKGKIEAKVTVLKRSPREGYMPGSTAYTIRMEDERGNIVVWFTSNLPGVKQGEHPFPVVGGVYTIKGTVKEHQDHERFGKSTIITRGSFEQTHSLPPKAEIEEQEEDDRYEQMYQ